jgi:DNA-binding GntR family transcriptional regulator
MSTSSNPLHQRVAQNLRDQIFSGQLAPGAFLDENQLCETLKISRTPLREALKVLSAEGLLRHEPRRGCFVNQITEKDLDDIFPVIALLEGRCAFEAARHANEADLSALGALHEQLLGHAKAGRVTEYYATNFVIHEAIISLAQNRWLSQSIADLRKILKLSRLQSLGANGRLAQSLEEHMRIFEAIKNRDSEGAQSAMRLHLTRQRDALREIAREQRKFAA